MASIARTEGCCGIRELYDLGETDPVETISEVADAILNHNLDAAFYLFADNYANRNGHRLAAYIKEHKLGKLTVAPSTYNPNSRNSMRAWLWQINRAAIITHADFDIL